MTEPTAWAIYGRKTGALRYVIQDESSADELRDHYDVRPLYESTPPADDVREALADLLMSDGVMNVDAAGREYAYVEADAILSRFEVRPRGTVTDAEKDAAHAEFCGCALRDKCDFWHASGLAIQAAREAQR